jgi:hypothetical protein
VKTIRPNRNSSGAGLQVGAAGRPDEPPIWGFVRWRVAQEALSWEQDLTELRSRGWHRGLPWSSAGPDPADVRGFLLRH